MRHKIIVFDDKPKKLKEVLDSVMKALRGKGKVQAFEPTASGRSAGTHEKRLERELVSGRNKSPSLIVADLDLSADKDYPGLSESTVRRVANTLGIPECGYARGEPGYVEEGAQRESCIRLAPWPAEDFARQVVSIAQGFALILGSLPAVLRRHNAKSLHQVLAELLGKPEYADKISLYAAGDRNRMAALDSIRVDTNTSQRYRRLACFLGYWLWDSVLHYPGVVANEVAASSHLNIGRDAFCGDAKIQDLFTKARYQGPFAEAKGRLWWRGALDDLVAGGGCADGRELVFKRLKKRVAQSKCCVNPKIPAGYYCMLSRNPVSLENSVAGYSWFPRGADLARVSRKANDELGPWLAV